MNLLILESPNKRKTIQGILGTGWRVEASYGHVAELSDDGPDNLGFRLTADSVEPDYVPRSDRAKQTLGKLGKLASKAELVYIATDPDREGEAIGWHLIDQLSIPTGKIRRVRYSEITEQAVQRAISNANPAIDQDLADAARARDILDKLVGYKVSPLLWNSSGGKSAGRVQSAALAIICRREQERTGFEPRPYWSLWVEYQEGFKAHLLKAKPDTDGEGSDDDTAEEVPAVEGSRIWNEADAKRLEGVAVKCSHSVVSIQASTQHRKPPAPFTTSTLQQAAGSKLGLSVAQVMKLAQSLFEGIELPQGRKSLITYHRTDAPVLSDEFKEAARSWLSEHDPENVPDVMPSYSAKKGAQEAHEAIRPTYLGIHPDDIQQHASKNQHQLYSLIWHRSIAACCRHAEIAKTRIVTESEGIYWEAKGQVVEFSGYSRYWNNLGDDQKLPELSNGQVLDVKEAKADHRKTSPPERYSEAKLVQALERLGVGRPSTFSSTIQTLRDRCYVRSTRRKLVPTKLGANTFQVLVATVPDLLNPEFTAEMEAALDAIASGEQNWQQYLVSWNRDYFAPAIVKAGQFVEEEYDNRPELTEHECPVCGGALEKYHYQKDGEEKALLRCHAANDDSAEADSQASCKDVAYFASNGAWWSPTYGQIGSSDIPSDIAVPGSACPVCQGQLEKHFYPKDGEIKSMVRCQKQPKSGCSDVAFFQTDSGYWSPKYGELKQLQSAN